MKQYITIEQLNELSDKGKKRLEKWCKKKMYMVCGCGDFHPHTCNHIVIPLLSIGQMIEFLGDHPTKEKYGMNFHPVDRCYEEQDRKGWHLVTSYTIERDELCDALWEAVKQVLEEER